MDVTKENLDKHNVNWPGILNHLGRILIIGGSESGKTNALLNLIKQQQIWKQNQQIWWL